MNHFIVFIRNVIILFIILFVTPSYAKISMNNTALMAGLMTQLDSNSALFVLNLLEKKGELIDNDKYFDAARALLPVKVKTYSLEEMNKNNGTLILKFSTTDEKIPLLWKKDKKKFIEKFSKGTCKAFNQAKFKTINQITASLFYQDKLVTTQSQKASDCK